MTQGNDKVNVTKLYETIAKIISLREGVEVRVTVTKKEEKESLEEGV